MWIMEIWDIELWILQVGMGNFSQFLRRLLGATRSCNPLSTTCCYGRWTNSIKQWFNQPMVSQLTARELSMNSQVSPSE